MGRADKIGTINNAISQALKGAYFYNKLGNHLRTEMSFFNEVSSKLKTVHFLFLVLNVSFSILVALRQNWIFHCRYHRQCFVVIILLFKATIVFFCYLIEKLLHILWSGTEFLEFSISPIEPNISSTHPMKRRRI